jgi:hypothetical protein
MDEDVLGQDLFVWQFPPTNHHSISIPSAFHTKYRPWCAKQDRLAITALVQALQGFASRGN